MEIFKGCNEQNSYHRKKNVLSNFNNGLHIFGEMVPESNKSLIRNSTPCYWKPFYMNIISGKISIKKFCKKKKNARDLEETFYMGNEQRLSIWSKISIPIG